MGLSEVGEVQAPPATAVGWAGAVSVAMWGVEEWRGSALPPSPLYHS